ncbi:MAG: glycosyltransferase family 2 protein [Nanoarchaeota archaeon]
MSKSNHKKVSVVMPIYKPDMEILEKIRQSLKKQTIESELVENWNMPEAKSTNMGIKRANGEIVVTLSADCLPPDEKWLETLIKPLEDKTVVVSVSDMYTPEWYWKKYSFLTRMLTFKELKIARPLMDARACAFRKKDLVAVGLFNEDPKVVGIDSDMYLKIIKFGKIVHTGVFIEHLHWLTVKKRLKMFYDYSQSNGKLVRRYGLGINLMWQRILRATPVLGIFSVFYTFPRKKYLYYFPLFIPAAILEHIIWVYGFWHGFFFDKESTRNIIDTQNI